MSARFDGLSDPVEFLERYAIAIRVSRGDGRMMDNWFLMATKGEPRRWLWELPQSPSRLGEASASASSTSSLPWG
jgi:hypothetical protein